MIELKELSVGYGKKEILKDISCSFEPGKLTSIIGINGSGKTTLVKTVASIIPSLKGEIFVDGNNVSLLSTKERAKKTAYLAQDNSIPDMTAGQMVLHGRFAHLSYPRVYSDKDKSIARSAIEKMGISSLSEAPLHQLSGGMRQKAYIAMALAQQSDYILLDEPTAYLDISNRIELMRTLKSLSAEGKGVVAVLHDLSLAMEFSDEIAVIHDGELVIKASPDEIFDSGIIKTAFSVSAKKIETDSGFCYHFFDII